MTTDIEKQFVKNVKAICKYKKIRIGDIEKMIGNTPGHLSRVASGKLNISLGSAYKIAEYLGYPFGPMVQEDVTKKFRIRELCDEQEELRKRMAEINNEINRISEGKYG